MPFFPLSFPVSVFVCEIICHSGFSNLGPQKTFCILKVQQGNFGQLLVHVEKLTIV